MTQIFLLPVTLFLITLLTITGCRPNRGNAQADVWETAVLPTANSNNYLFITATES